MKAATRLLMRHQARAREADTLRNLRGPDATIPQNRYPGQQLPLSLAPYRLQAADRWWRENAPSPDPTRKRPS